MQQADRVPGQHERASSAVKQGKQASIRTSQPSLSPRERKAAQLAKQAGCNCVECPFSFSRQPHKLAMPVGPLHPKGVIVCESPGREEVERDEVLVGPTGRELNRELLNVGLVREKLFLVNAIACQPKEPKTEHDMRKATECCKPLLQMFLKPRTGAPMLLCGKWAAEAVRGEEKGALAHRGFVDFERKQMIVHHPTYALFYEPYEAGTFVKDLEHFSMLCNGVPQRPMKLHAIATVKQNKKALAVLRKLRRKHKWLACDIETTASADAPWEGLDATRAWLKVIGFGTADEAVAIYWNNAGPELRRFVAHLLADATFTKVFHNGWWFDVRVLERYRMPVHSVEDTRDLRRAHSSTSRLSLGHLAALYDYTNNWKASEEEDDAKGMAFTTNLRKLLLYNGQDCIETARVYEGLLTEKTDARVERLYEVHTQLSKITARMNTAGVWLNKDNRKFMLWCLEQQVTERTEALKQKVNVDGFEATDDHLRAIIYQRHEWTKRMGGKKRGTDFRIAKFGLDDPLNPKMYTDDTQETISVDEKRLLLLIAGGDAPEGLIPILDAWWDVQEAKKQRGYLNSEDIDHALSSDGRVRPGWNSCGTETMRFTCKGPPMMVYKQVLRCIFGPPPGKVWVHIDKSQLELRVMEAVAGDDVLYKALQTGDVYTFDARQWFDIPADYPVKKEARQGCKIIHLSSQYGAGITAIFVQALMQDRAFKFSKARLLNQAFKQTYFGTVDYWHREMKQVMAQGYSEGRLLHGRRVYPAPPDLSDVANYPIQRTAAEMMNLELIDLHERLKREVPTARIVTQLHDAVDVECNERDEEKVKRIMIEVHDREWTIEGRRRRYPVELKVARGSATSPAWPSDWSDV